MQSVTIGGLSVVYGGESLGTMVRWRRLVTDAIRPGTMNEKLDGAEGFGEFVRQAAEMLTLEAKLALIYAWQPELEAREAELLEKATDEEVEAAFGALMRHAYPLAKAARPLAPMNGAAPKPGQATEKSFG
jgi:hypothetical protein